MKRAALQAAIQAAELNLALNKRQTRESLERARSAFFTTISRPKYVGTLLGASALVGFILAPRRRVVRNEIRLTQGAPVASVVALLLPLLVRYAIAIVPELLQSRHAARHRSQDASGARH